MNRLVEHLEKHHNPGGNAINHVRVDDLLVETEWTRAEIYTMALEAREAAHAMISIPLHNIQDN